jgi:hypothetical protein
MTTLGYPIPILRIFDEAKAREFYLGFLGFAIDFEHRFGDDFPIYMGISRASCVLHLSEHHGDACPGSAVRIPITGIADFGARLSAANYKYAKPGGPERTTWGTLELKLGDPFGNRLIFYETVTG